MDMLTHILDPALGPLMHGTDSHITLTLLYSDHMHLKLGHPIIMIILVLTPHCSPAHANVCPIRMHWLILGLSTLTNL